MLELEQWLFLNIPVKKVGEKNSDLPAKSSESLHMVWCRLVTNHSHEDWDSRPVISSPAPLWKYSTFPLLKLNLITFFIAGYGSAVANHSFIFLK